MNELWNAKNSDEDEISEENDGLRQRETEWEDAVPQHDGAVPTEGRLRPVAKVRVAPLRPACELLRRPTSSSTASPEEWRLTFCSPVSTSLRPRVGGCESPLRSQRVVVP